MQSLLKSWNLKKLHGKKLLPEKMILTTRRLIYYDKELKKTVSVSFKLETALIFTLLTELFIHMFSNWFLIDRTDFSDADIWISVFRF